MAIISQPRKSLIETGNVYFWTATIKNWQKLLVTDHYKQVIIDSLQHLSNKGKIQVYAFVIMPNHIHLVWQMLEKNGKESAHGSFLKFTAHAFKKQLCLENPAALASYTVQAANKNYEFWQQDPLAVHLYSREVTFQKITYIHNNPLQEHWNLCTDPVKYPFSSAKFYETGVDDVGFLKHIGEIL